MPFTYNWKLKHSERLTHSVVQAQIPTLSKVSHQLTSSMRKKTIHIYEDNSIKLCDQMCEWFGEFNMVQCDMIVSLEYSAYDSLLVQY